MPTQRVLSDPSLISPVRHNFLTRLESRKHILRLTGGLRLWLSPPVQTIGALRGLHALRFLLGLGNRCSRVVVVGIFLDLNSV